MIGAIVLAAGRSTRMGQTKQLLQWEGKILLNHVLDELRRSRVDERILVLGHDAERVLRAAQTGGVRVVVNHDYVQGMITSIQRGLAALPEEAEGFFIVLGDQPEIPAEIYDRLIDEFHLVHPRKGILIPTCQGRRGHPTLFSGKYRDEAMRITGDVGLRPILQAHPEDILTVAVDSDAILLDIDTPEDFQRYLRRQKPKGGP